MRSGVRACRARHGRPRPLQRLRDDLPCGRRAPNIGSALRRGRRAGGPGGAGRGGAGLGGAGRAGGRRGRLATRAVGRAAGREAGPASGARAAGGRRAAVRSLPALGQARRGFPHLMRGVASEVRSGVLSSLLYVEVGVLGGEEGRSAGPCPCRAEARVEGDIDIASGGERACNLMHARQTQSGVPCAAPSGTERKAVCNPTHARQTQSGVP
jgi:hypothetical protein